MKWIESGMAGGGVLTVRNLVGDTRIFQAELKWKEDDFIKGKIAMSLQGALDNLQQAIVESQQAQT